MQLTIIVPDGVVLIDGVSRHMDLSGYGLAGVHAVHWFGSSGYIQAATGAEVSLTSIAQFQPIITAFNKSLNVPVSLQECKEQRLVHIQGKAQAESDALAAGYPSFEQLTWADQEREARAWLARGQGEEIETPTVDGIASARGIDKEELCRRIIAKADLYRPAAAAIIGKRQRLEDEIHAATTNEAVMEIDW